MAIYAFLAGELPPRHLPGVDPSTAVEVAAGLVGEVFGRPGAPCELALDGKPLEEGRTLREYGIREEALINARWKA